MNRKICYRFVNEDMTSHQDNKILWKIGEWKKQEGKLKCCENGLHASLTPYKSINNVYGNRWFIAEYKGKIVKEDDKFCASEMRLVKEIPIKVLQYFAIRCAKRVLKFYEKHLPDDKRPALAIQAAEDFLDEKIKINELRNADAATAAHAAVYAADATYAAAAYAANAYAADTADAYAADTADAYAAATAATAAYATHAAEKKWQIKELNKLIKEYAK
jgi:hypothetical protein